MVNIIFRRNINTDGILGNVHRFSEDFYENAIKKHLAGIEDMYCENHPDFENTLQAELNGNEVSYIATQVCCSNFAKHLVEMANNRGHD